MDLQTGFPWGASDTSSDLSGNGRLSERQQPILELQRAGIRFSGQTAKHSVLRHSAGLYCCDSDDLLDRCGRTLRRECTTSVTCTRGADESRLLRAGCWCSDASAYGTIGNAGRNIFRTQPFYNVDLSVFKDFKLKENITAEFRAEFYNLFNRADFAVPATVNPESGLGFGCACTTLDAAGQNNSVLGSGGPRSMQIGLKLSF